MIYSYMHYGELPKRLKGAVSKTARRESVRGFKSLILRHTLISALIKALFCFSHGCEKILRRFNQESHHFFILFLKQMCIGIHSD